MGVYAVIKAQGDDNTQQEIVPTTYVVYTKSLKGVISCAQTTSNQQHRNLKSRGGRREQPYLASLLQMRAHDD